MPQPPSPDRRERRTTDPLVALSRLFESARKRGDLEALVLADDAGLAIAGAGTASACDELAAASTLVNPAANDTVPCRLDVVSRSARLRRLRIDGMDVVLCAEGDGPESLAALGHAADGCRRILGEGRPERLRSAVAGESRGNSFADARFDVAKRSPAT